MSFSHYTTKKNKSLTIVAPPPSVGKQAGDTNLDAALAHLRPNVERLLPPRIRKNETGDKADTARKPKR